MAEVGTCAAVGRSICDKPYDFYKLTGCAMADRNALGTIGLMLGAATMMVMMVGTMVVTDHLTGRLHIDDGLQMVSLPSTAR